MTVQITLNTDVENTTMVIKSKLLALKEEGGYVTYVFVDLESKEYLMCVQFPNWEHRSLRLGEIGFLEYKEIRAGIDTWFDGSKMIPYNYNNIQFIKLIPKPEEKKPYVMYM